MPITTKQEAHDFLTSNNPNIQLDKKTIGTQTLFFGKTSMQDEDEQIADDLVQALNIAVQAFINQDCSL